MADTLSGYFLLDTLIDRWSTYVDAAGLHPTDGEVLALLRAAPAAPTDPRVARGVGWLQGILCGRTMAPAVVSDGGDGVEWED